MTSFSLDRLTILGDMNEDLENLISYLEYRILLNRMRSAYPYEYAYTIPGGKGIIQVARKDAKVPRIRFEFNPKHSKDPEIFALYRSIIGYLKNVYCTRADLAFDYEEDLEGMRWIDYLGRPGSMFWGGAGDNQTYYVGGASSKLQIVTYNKRAERASKMGLPEETISSEDWWRIEARLDKDEVRNFLEDDSYNPFNDAVPYSTIPLGMNTLKATDKLILLGLLTPEGKTILADLSFPTRKKYKQMLETYTMPLPIDIKGDFEDAKKDLREQVYRWLNYARVVVS